MPPDSNFTYLISFFTPSHYSNSLSFSTEFFFLFLYNQYLAIMLSLIVQCAGNHVHPTFTAHQKFAPPKLGQAFQSIVVQSIQYYEKKVGVSWSSYVYTAEVLLLLYFCPLIKEHNFVAYTIYISILIKHESCMFAFSEPTISPSIM